MAEELRRFVALEIASKAVRLVCGYTQDGLVYVLHALETSANALDAGQVVESDTLTAAIKSVINTASDNLGIRIRDVILALPPMGLVFPKERASTNTIGLDNRIVQIDINNCLSQIKKVKIDDKYKIIDVIPINYVIENGNVLTEAPIGRTSSSLTVNACIYALDRKIVDGYVKVVESCGLKVRQAVVAPFASALYLQDCDQIKDNVSNYFLLNMGSEITTITQIANKSTIVQNGCFKFGGDVITSYISKKLNIPMKDAKMLKEKYGIDKEPSFKVNVYENYTIKDISLAIREAITPVIQSIKKQISQWSSNDSRYLPIVLTGGGSKLRGLKEILEKEFQVSIIDVRPYSFGARDKCYQNCLGLIKYADKYIQGDIQDDFSNTVITRTTNNKESSKRMRLVHEYDVNEDL